jgi:hypothetical protein
MKITLAFMVYRPGARWAEALYSWLFHLSGKHSCEVICTFDDPEDRHHTVNRASRVLSQFRTIDYKPLHTGDINELRANNAALKAAAPDSNLFVVLQDDNHCRDMGWDAIVLEAMTRAAQLTQKPIGTVGLLAGLAEHPNAQHQRVECWRSNKSREFPPSLYSNIVNPNLPLKVYAVDSNIRPLAVYTKTMRQYGGFDEIYAPRDWDCVDLGVRLLRAGHQNIYVPLDVENWCVKREAQKPGTVGRYHARNRQLFLEQHQTWFATDFKTTYRPLFDFIPEIV